MRSLTIWPTIHCSDPTRPLQHDSFLPGTFLQGSIVHMEKQKVVVVGAGPVGALAALYAADRGHDVEVYELRGGK